MVRLGLVHNGFEDLVVDLLDDRRGLRGAPAVEPAMVVDHDRSGIDVGHLLDRADESTLVACANTHLPGVQADAADPLAICLVGHCITLLSCSGDLVGN